MTHTIIGIHLTNRTEEAAGLQQILSKYGCSIKTRIGLHETSEGQCSPGGLILLEVISKADELIQELSGKFEVKTMQF